MLLVAFLWKFRSSDVTKLCCCCRLLQAGAGSSSPEPAPKEKVSAAFPELLSLMDLHTGNCWWAWHCANIPVVEMQTIMKRSLTPWTLPRLRSRSWLVTTKLWKLLMGTCWRSSGMQRWGSVWPESCCTGSRDVPSFSALTGMKEIYSGGRELVLIHSWGGLNSTSWALDCLRSQRRSSTLMNSWSKEISDPFGRGALFSSMRCHGITESWSGLVWKGP